MYSACQVAKVLISHGADVNRANSEGNTPLRLCLYFNSNEVAEALIDYGADINRSDSKGNTPLHGCRNTEVTSADVNKTNSEGNTPRCLCKNEEMAKALVDTTHSLLQSPESQALNNINSAAFSPSPSHQTLLKRKLSFSTNDNSPKKK